MTRYTMATESMLPSLAAEFAETDAAAEQRGYQRGKAEGAVRAAVAHDAIVAALDADTTAGRIEALSDALRALKRPT